MSNFSCPVVKVKEVVDHPNADRLSIVRLDGLEYTCISAKLDDGTHRYKSGDFVVYIPSAALLPEWLLKEMGFWNQDNNVGTLAGSNGNRVKPLRLRGIFSEGVLYPTMPMNLVTNACMIAIAVSYDSNDGMPMLYLGDDASEVLGITKYEPPIPVSMQGQVANLMGHTVKYDFERWESVPEIFDASEHVVATEKLHGTCTAIRFIPGLNHPEMFGSFGDIIVYSKGLGAQGLVFKNVVENDTNLYVIQLRKLLNSGLEDRLRKFSNNNSNASILIMGETFGQGVQDLSYGINKPEFRVFDIAIDNAWIDGNIMPSYAEMLGLTSVPILYDGVFDVAELEKVRDGSSTIGGNHVREGIVVRAVNTIPHPVHGRKIAKFISPDYLLRKSKQATEYT
jgi:RNA ligase (TIGR02306 family)